MKLLSAFLRPLLLLTSQSSPSFPSGEGSLDVRSFSVAGSPLQQWYQLAQEGYCLQHNVNSFTDDEVKFAICKNDRRDQMWKYEGEKSWLVHKNEGCLAIKKNQMKIVGCSESDADQLWELDGKSLSPRRMHWSDDVTTNIYKSGSVVLQLS